MFNYNWLFGSLLLIVLITGVSTTCKVNEDCQAHSSCVNMGGSTGICLCEWGYRNFDGKCTKSTDSASVEYAGEGAGAGGVERTVTASTRSNRRQTSRRYSARKGTTTKTEPLIEETTTAPKEDASFEQITDVPEYTQPPSWENDNQPPVTEAPPTMVELLPRKTEGEARDTAVEDAELTLGSDRVKQRPPPITRAKNNKPQSPRKHGSENNQKTTSNGNRSTGSKSSSETSSETSQSSSSSSEKFPPSATSSENDESSASDISSDSVSATAIGGGGFGPNGDGSPDGISSDEAIRLSVKNDSVHTVDCPQVAGGSCYNSGQCLQLEKGNAWCICGAQWGGSRCQLQKPEGLLARLTEADVKTTINARFVNQRYPDGSTWARHAVRDFNQCISLCEISGPACHSVNYGSVNDNNICELLAVRVTDDDELLKPWVVASVGWRYGCCIGD